MGLNIESKISIGEFKKGPRNLITDVPGVRVGHCTLEDGDINTGITAILPHDGNIFKEKVMAANHIINGFGKSIGLMQIDEMGTIETPIMLTNTLSVGTVATGLIRYMLENNEDICNTTGTVNPIVMECNDYLLNDIRGLHVKEEHVIDAINDAQVDFEEGAVGAGKGLRCYGLKGGIGSSSRLVIIDDVEYIVGALVMTNFGATKNLIIDGKKVGQKIVEIKKAEAQEIDKGSVIIVIATNLPLSERQLKRIAKRSVIGLGRTGSFMGNASGDICVAFTTANIVKHYNEDGIIDYKMICEDKIENAFRAVIESVEEAVISSLYHAETTSGKNITIKSLKEYLK